MAARDAPSQAERRRLLDAQTKLYKQWKARKISSAEFRRRRAVLKSKLSAATQSAKKAKRQ